ncbi:MAG: hypothetical protein OXI10_13885 [Gammaproteobacteria bacterium]|nr:hypothetical protein [Gammaproteobacteria bacterium]
MVFPVFEDARIKSAADDTADQALERRLCEPFCEDFTDPGDLTEYAFGEGLNRYMDLVFVKGQLHALSVAALYHLWERTLKAFLILELRAEGLANRKSRTENAGFAVLMDDLAALGFNVRKKGYFDSLETVLLVANVCKHGDGDSFVKLQQKAPELFSGKNEWRNLFPGKLSEFFKPRAEDLWITPIRFEELGASIEEFWRSMPERLPVPESWYRAHDGRG